MQFRSLAAVIALLALAAGPLAAHEVDGISHTHAFEQKDYGTYRQGHSVNNQNGDIIIWSPKPYTGYQNTSPVRFARPEPITRAPSSPFVPSKAKQDPARDYGKKSRRN